MARDYDTLTQAASRKESVTVLCDLAQGINSTPGEGALLEQVGSRATQPFVLWIAHRHNDTGNALVHLIEMRYAAGKENGEGGRGYAYVTGTVVLYQDTPEIVLENVAQLSDFW